MNRFLLRVSLVVFGLMLIVGAGRAQTASISAGGNTTFCQGGNVTLSISIDTFATYQWQLNNSDIKNATSASYNAIQTGSYAVVVKPKVGNNSTSNSISVKVNSLPDATLSGKNPLLINGVTYFRECASRNSFQFPFFNNSSTSGTNNSYKIIWGDGTAYTDPQFLAEVNKVFPIGLTEIIFQVTNQYCSSQTKYRVFLGNVPAGGLNNTGGATICQGNKQSFTIGGYQSNPPGTLYSLHITDGTKDTSFFQPPPDTVWHTFNISSCSSPVANGNTTYNNAFAAYLSITNPCDVKGASSSAIPIYVSGIPKSSFSISNDTVCVNTTVTFQNNSNKGNDVVGDVCTVGSSVWSLNPSGSNFSIIQGQLGRISSSGTIISGGTDAISINFSTSNTYKVKLSTGFDSRCGIDSLTKTVVVTIPPNVNTVPDQTVCNGAIVVLPVFSSNKSGTDFVWSNSNTSIGLKSSASGNIPSFTATNTNTVKITATITVTPTAGGCSGIPISFTITVNPSPPYPRITSPINSCQNSIATLSAAASTGSTLNWYTTFKGGTPSNTVPTVSTSTIGTQNFYVSQTNTSTSCESGRADIMVKISAIPSITATTSNPSSCGSIDGYIILSGLDKITTYSLSYNNTVINSNATSDGNGQLKIFGLSAGSYNNITVTNNTGCTSNALSVSLSAPLSPAAPTVAQTTPQILCSGDTLKLSVSNPINNATYTWSGAGITNSNNTGTSIIINSITIADSGNYSVIASINKCPSQATNIRVLVNQTPSIPQITGTSSVCTGSPINLTALTSTTGNVTYSWVLADNSTNSTNAISIASASTTNAGTYKAKATLGTCVSPEASFAVAVNVTPNISSSSITTPATCASSTGSIILNGLAANKPYTVNYNGTASATTFTTDGTGTLTFSSLAAGTYSNISVTDATGCQSNQVGPFTLKDPTPPAAPTASGASEICSGKTYNLTGNNSVSGVTYSWTGPNNFKSDSQNPAIHNISTANTGAYQFKVILAGCNSDPATVNVVVDSTPVTPTISPILPLCEGGKLVLSAASATSGIGSISYQWSGPNGFSSSLKEYTKSPATASDSGTYKVITTNTNGAYSCVSDAASIYVTIRPSITQAKIIGSKDTLICGFNTTNNNLGNLLGNLDATRSYETGSWSVVQQPAGANASIANSTNKNTIITFDKSGVYLVQWAISNTVCSPTTDTIKFEVFDKPTIIAQSLSTRSIDVCASNPVTVSISDADYYGQIKQWQIKRPFTSTSWKDTAVQSNTITFNNVQDTFIVRLMVVSKDTLHCGTDSVIKDLQINVAPPSNAGTASGLNTVCQGTNSGSISLTGNTGSPTWQSSPDSVVFTNISNSAGTQFNYTNLTQTTWYRSAVKSGTCDTVFSNAIKITVVPPVTVANAGADKSLCADSVYRLEGNTPSSLETGTWTFSSTDTGRLDDIHNPSTFIRGLKANTNYTLIWSIDNHVCSKSTASVTITNLNPLTNAIDTATKTYCNSATVSVNGIPASGGNGSNSYQWELKQGNSWYAIPNATSAGYSFTADTSVVLHRLVVAGPCTSTSLEKTVYVQPPLGNNFITGSGAACINTPIGLLTGSTPSGADGSFIYQWQQTTDTINTPWTEISGAISKDYTAPIVTQNVFYKRIVTSQLCAGSQSNTSPVFVVLVRPDAQAQWQINTDTACAPFSIDNSSVSPVIDTVRNSSYSWYAHDSLYGNSANINPGYTLVPAGDSVSIKMVAVSRYGCKNDSLSHWFITPPSPITTFKVSDTADCGPLADTLTNLTPLINRFHYFWDYGFAPTSTSVSIQPGVVIFPPNPLNKDTIYTIKLTAFNQCDTVTVSKNIKVRSKAKAIFTPVKTFGCSPMVDTFINTSRGDSTKYLWQFGDGATLSTTDSLPVTHTYHTGAQDTFTVKLIAINYCGNDTGQYAIVVAKSTIDLRITVNGNELTNCRNSHVHFINTTKGASTINWDFGDGNHATTFGNSGGLDTVVHQYDTVGTFKITYQASNNCTDTTGSLLIKVLSTPKAAFIATPDTVCIGHPISFTNKSDATTGLVWSFGDGKGSFLTNPSHSYTNAGNDTVELIAVRQHTSANICRDTAIRQVTIIPSLPGYIKASDSVSVCVPFTVTFTNTFAASTKLCTWNFDDGTTTTGNVVTHTFTKVRAYNVSMSAVDTGGCNYIANKQITVNGPAGSFLYDHGIICGKVPVKLEATVTGTDSLRWNMGNGEFVTTLPNTPLSYLYPQSGKFVPNVTLLSAGGKCKVKLNGIDTVTIDKVEAGFSVNQLRVCDKTTANFVDTSRAYLGLNSWSWNFGDSKSSAMQNPTHIYLTTNDWATQLIVKSKSGCSDTANLPTYIKINNTPQASILVDTIGCVMQAVLYNAVVTSIDSATYFSWKFSNGTTANTPTANAYYSLAGSYTAKLIVGTAFGCYDTAAIATVKIYPTPQVVTNPDFQLCKGQSAFVNTTGAATYQWTPSLGLSCNTCYNPIASPITTTRYVVAGYNKYGCAGRDTMIVTVIQPFKLITSGNDTMCIGDAAHQLTVSGASNYNWFPSTGLSATNIATPLANPPITTDYQIIGTDNYHCFSDTAHLVVAVGTYPSVALGPDLVLSTGTKVTMMPVFTYPTQTAGPIGKHVWTPSTYLSCDGCESPIATVEKDVCYTLAATNIYGCSANTDTLCIKAFCKESQVFIANAFTPDGDGVNDILVVQGKGIRVINSFRVFNRWGQVVFEQTNFQPNDKAFGWDGKIKGVPAAADVYVYTCQVVCENDVAFVYKGNTSIIR